MVMGMSSTWGKGETNNNNKNNGNYDYSFKVLLIGDSDCVKILVGNKVDKDGERAVSREEGMALAQEHKSLFLECSAKKRENVQQCFKELTLKILDIPSLLEKGSAVVKRQILKQKHRGGQLY
ncbi:hypothetical protein ACSBR1_007411 [Camellia fascicularis]